VEVARRALLGAACAVVVGEDGADDRKVQISNNKTGKKKHA
jgi:hypothetical protein